MLHFSVALSFILTSPLYVGHTDLHFPGLSGALVAHNGSLLLN